MYNKQHPENEAIKNKKVNMTFSYEEMRALSNFLYDVHHELDKDYNKFLHEIKNVACILNELKDTRFSSLVRRVSDLSDDINIGMRLSNYPVEEMKPIHQAIYNRFLNCMMSLELE